MRIRVSRLQRRAAGATSMMRETLLAVILLFNGVQIPGEPPAALRRPNLQVLKTIPESQLFPVMNALSDSLGVRCDYCHVRINPDPAKTWSLAGGWVWDRDDKPAKIIARDMMRMVLAINQQQALNGAKVTCFTCHRGSTTPARFPPLPPDEHSTDGAPAARPLPSADAVWSAYIRAVGGEGAANGFATTIMSAIDDRSEGRRGSIEVIFKGSDRFRMTLRVPPDGPVSQAVDKGSGWVAIDAVTRPLRPDEVVRARRSSMRFRVIKLERPSDLRIVGVERVGNREAYVAATDVGAPSQTTWFFDTETGLLLRERKTTETDLLPLQEQIDYEDYRQVDGVTVPFRTRWSDGSPFSTSVRTFTSIRHNVDVEDSVFKMPAVRTPVPDVRLKK
jgi:hypothetical protein